MARLTPVVCVSQRSSANRPKRDSALPTPCDPSCFPATMVPIRVFASSGGISPPPSKTRGAAANTVCSSRSFAGRWPATRGTVPGARRRYISAISR